VAVKYATNWKQLGKNLNVQDEILKIIEKDYGPECEECCSRMLNQWIEVTPNATWGMLLEAVDKIEGMYIYLYRTYNY